LLAYLVSLWLHSRELVLDLSGIKYNKLERIDYIHSQISDWFKQTMNVDPSFYENISIVKIDLVVENDISEQKIGKENKIKLSNHNFASQLDILDHLKTLSGIKKPLSLSFFACTIDSEIIALLDSIQEIQSLTFSYCSFAQCSLKNINTSQYFFSLTLSKCTSDQEWNKTLSGIKNFYKLNIWHTSVSSNDLPDLFSSQINIENLEMQFMKFEDQSFCRVIFAPHLKNISILNSNISKNDIIRIVNTVGKKTTFQLRNCKFNPTEIQ
jgi:hypothetical protein